MILIQAGSPLALAVFSGALVNLKVSDLSNHNVIELPVVYSRPSPPVSMNAIGTQGFSRWPHLTEITVPNIEAEIGLLIGSDVPQLLQSVEMRESKNGSPFATRTVL